MRNKETLLIILFLCVAFLLMYGCASKKTAIKTEEQACVQKEVKRTYSDSANLNITIDTTIYGNKVISIDKVEYYPATDIAEGTKQQVKAITKVVVESNKKKSGKTEINIAEVRKEDTASELDSAVVNKQDIQQTVKKPGKSCTAWLWLLIIAIVAAVVYRNKNR